ncbi:MAG: DUF4350 domain-containing protein [Planctomycetaceae bacterium]
MLTPRNAIFAAALLFALLVISSVVSSLRGPDHNGIDSDSFGVRRAGYRGLVDTLAQLGIPVERQLAPWQGDPPPAATVVLLEPQPLLVRTEPQSLERLSNWVQRGGRLVVAPDFASETEQHQLDNLAKEHDHFNQDLLPVLGLKGVRVELLHSSDVPPASPVDDEELVISSVTAQSTVPAAEELQTLVTLGEALPEVLWEEDQVPVWQTRILDAKGDERVLAAGFPLGNGEIIVVSDSTLFSNVTLPRGSNAVWLVAMLTADGRQPVVFDEFYHGLTIRGNAWWLLTRPALAGLATCGLLLLGLWTWRRGVSLGPPLADQTPTRRMIGEYISAMAHFFLRGRDAERFVLREQRDGVWRRLCQQSGLPPGRTTLDQLVARYDRQDPQQAAQIQTTLLAADQALTRSNAAAHPPLLEIMRDLSILGEILS